VKESTIPDLSSGPVNITGAPEPAVVFNGAVYVGSMEGSHFRVDIYHHSTEQLQWGSTIGTLHMTFALTLVKKSSL